jgi:pimeloyl-ACP methyl ester carboxylesterase
VLEERTHSRNDRHATCHRYCTWCFRYTKALRAELFCVVLAAILIIIRNATRPSDVVRQMPLAYRGETKVLDEASRAYASGSFIRLSKGLTHYKLSGPEGGEVVVLIHGIAGPMGIWNNVTTCLSEIGFRVLQYDLYGRGYSDRPTERYDIDLFAEQFRQLVVELKLKTPMSLIGWSLGGMISGVYATRFPGEVNHLILIAPAGLDVTLPTTARIGMVPVLGELLISMWGRGIVLKSLTRGLHRRELAGEYIALVSEQMQHRGYLRAFLSTLRHCAYRDSTKEYQAVGELGISVLLISGSEDTTIPVSARNKIVSLIPDLEHREIKGAGHIPMLEAPEAVRTLLLDFIYPKGVAFDKSC